MNKIPSTNGQAYSSAEELGILDDILGALPADQISQQVGASPDEVRTAAAAVLVLAAAAAFVAWRRRRPDEAPAEAGRTEPATAPAE